MNTKTSKGANALNDFYARFDCHDFSEVRNNLTDRLTSSPAEERGECITRREDEDLRQLQRTNRNEAAEPDGMKPSILSIVSSNCVLYSESFSISASLNAKYRPRGRPLA